MRVIAHDRRPGAVGVALVVLFAALGTALAQTTWSVQTVALRDYQEAQGVAAGLRLHGLDAYTEFTMQSGLQYVRVRVGCTDEREVADAWAGLLARSLVAEAVVVAMEGAPPLDVACVAAEVGFRKPGRWTLVSGPGEVPVFEVEIADHLAYLSYDGLVWRVWQGTAPAPVAASAARVVAARLDGRDVVRSADGGLLCPGRLIASIGDAAVVELGDAIVACRPAPAGGLR
ncbi:MAG: SPOR domain-containing protein [Trueperaceae bacterium]